MYGDNVNQIYHGDYFAMYGNIKSLFCTPEANIYMSIIPQ